MSALAGVVALAGRVVDRAPLEALAAPAPGNAVDGLGVWVSGSVGLAHALARVVPEAAEEVQPLVDAATGCALVFDGRLDNRADLRVRLGDDARLSARASDAAYALAAYLRWERDTPRHLLGDFAFALWDPRVRRLLLARDPAGLRPLYYEASADRLAFASTLEQLLGDRALARDLDEETVLWYLYDFVTPRGGRTFHRDVRIVPGGHTLTVEDGRATLARYWRWPDRPPERPFVTERDVDELRALFTEAVRCRLRSSGPVALTLSGGLDSGAIACTAGHLRHQAGLAPIHAYSVVFDRFPSCDERRYSTACAARWGFAHDCLVADDHWTLAGLDQWLPVFTEPYLGAYDDLHYAMLARARADGARAVLTGQGGDHLFAGSPHYLGAWLLRGHLGALHRQARARARESRRSYALAVADGALFPLLPVRLQERVMARRSLTAPVPEAWRPPHVDARHAPPSHAFRHSGPDAWWRRLHRIVSGFGQTPIGAHGDQLARRFGLEPRLPFLDVRLIEFALRTPPDAFLRGSTMKWILRQSLRDLLPPVVRDRPDKGNYTPLSAHGLRRRRRAFVEALLVDSELARRGYVRPDAWRQAILGYLHRDDEPLYWANWRSLTLEMWLRRREGRLPPLELSPEPSRA